MPSIIKTDEVLFKSGCMQNKGLPFSVELATSESILKCKVYAFGVSCENSTHFVVSVSEVCSID
jgi:hypothetical protein